MNSPRSAGLIIILDTGPQMAPHWPVIRNGIAQMMLVLTKDTLIGGKYKLQALLFQLRLNSPAPLTDNWKVTDNSSVNFHDVFSYIFCQIIAKNEEKHVMEIYG